jgi:hypothetical protein
VKNWTTFKSGWKNCFGRTLAARGGLTKAGVRKMTARLQEEIGFFEGSWEFEESPTP